MFGAYQYANTSSLLPFKTGLIDYDNAEEDENAKKFHVSPIQGRDRLFYDLDVSNKLNTKALELVNARLWQAHELRKQRLHEVHMKVRIWNMLSDALKPVFPNAYLALGGSTVNRFGTGGSDLDLCLALRCGDDDLYVEKVSLYVLITAQKVLEEKPFICSIELVAARVPILKLQLNFPFNEVEVDINCNCVAGIFNSHLLRYYAILDKRVPAMVTYLKDWAAEVKVVDPKFGGVNSYTIMLMVIHFLQCGVDPPILPNLIALFPKLFEGDGSVEDLEYDIELDIPVIKRNNRTLAELMFGFLNYYEQFDYENAGISIREARLFDRRRRPREDSRFLFFIEEAYDGLTVPKNLTKQHKLDRIRQCFQEGRDYLLMDLLGGLPTHLMAHITREWQNEDEEERDYYASDYFANTSKAEVAPWKW